MGASLLRSSYFHSLGDGQFIFPHKARTAHKFRCSVCGAGFDEPKLAEDCEMQHERRMK